MIARSGDVVVLESPAHMPREAMEDMAGQLAKLHELTGVRFVFVPPGTKSPEPEGMKALVDEVAKLRVAVEAATKAARGPQYGGPR